MRKSHAAKGVLFILPGFGGVLVFWVLPSADVVRRSFTSAVDNQFTGLYNYRTVFANQAFRLAAGNTLRFFAVCIPLLVALSLAVAVLLTRMNRGAQGFKAMFLLPMAIPVASVVVLWRLLFDTRGFLNHLWILLGLSPVDWINTDASFWVLVVSYFWRNLGYDMLLWIAALNAIPSALYEAARVDGADDASDDTEQALLDDIRQKHEALNSAITSRNEAILSAEQQKAEAELSEASDSTLANAERELENAREELDELKELQASGGMVTPPADGVIKELNITTGGVTGTEAAVILYLTGGELCLTGTIDGDDAKYVEIGGKVSVKDSDGNLVEGTVVEALRADETDDSIRTVSILLPEGSLSIGQTASFTIAKSEGPFASCVPLSALYQENGSWYVYVVDSSDSVLGEVLTARRVEVTVTDKNETLAALGGGVLTSGQQIIVESDREISEGSRVRLAE